MPQPKESETVRASEIEVGDEVHFPNSRKPQEVAGVLANIETGVITLVARDANWQLGPDADVRRVVKNTEET